MKQLHNSQQGVGHLAAIVLVLVVAAVAVIGYRVAQNSNTTTTSNSPAAIVVPDKIQSTADVKKADRALDNSGIDGSVDPNTLDGDLNSLL